MKTIRIKFAIKFLSLASILFVFFLNMDVKVGERILLDNNYDAMAYMMFGEAKCYGGPIGDLWHLPTCQNGCPYVTFSIMNEIGTCNNDPITE